MDEEYNNDNIEQVLSSSTTTATLSPTNHQDNNNTIQGEDVEGDEFYIGRGNTRTANSSVGGSFQERKLRAWRESPFAVGLVSPTWWDDRPTWYFRGNNSRRNKQRKQNNDNDDGEEEQYDNNIIYDDDDDDVDDIDRNLPASSIVCSCIGAGRVGNMAVLAQTIEEYHERTINQVTGEESIQRKKRPKLLWVIGPYWTVNFFITFPLILGVSAWVGYRRIVYAHVSIVISWTIGTFLLLFSLCMVSCRNPGILYRHAQPPQTQSPRTQSSSSNTTGNEQHEQQQQAQWESQQWRWNDQAKSYRPPKARFDPETQVVVEGFDHT
jgi:hypothetical protein